ncbi:hypothetical protein [Algivirga pacifica]|uniref:Tetratricopeptide repeat-containing protein n=1 Tax=Algivirga pacifica TaxID=1162670 RepID=A0ABP9D9T6_9BACT
MRYQKITLLLLSFLLTQYLSAQTFTMGKKCKEKLEQARMSLESKDYSGALEVLEDFSGDCKTKDAKEQGAIAKAEAYNGLKQYDQAVEEADKALKATKDRSLGGHFQKAIALEGVGDAEGAKSSLNKVIELTEENQNTTEKASNYALMAALYDRQLGERDSAFMYLEKAMELDANNPNFYIQKGDMYVYSDEYDKAFTEGYDKAVAMGKEDLEMYIIRSNARLKMLQHKYGTTEARELKQKMTEEEKQLTCTDLQKALSMGWEAMDKDLFATMICK